MLEPTGLSKFKEQFPNRIFDVGIAEQHAVTMAAGLASNGLKPYVAIYSTFLQRAYDQILHDVCIQDLPVRLAIDRAGLVGEDGETHQGVFDISYLNHIPNMTIFAPKNTYELRNMLDFTLSYEKPVAIRYPKGYTNIPPLSTSNDQKDWFNPFDWEILIRGDDCCILSFGRMLEVAIESAEILKELNIEAQVINSRCLKPLDNEILESIARSHTYWITLEDNVIAGGFGSAINNYKVLKGLDVRIMNLGIPDKFIPQGKVEQQLKLLSLDAIGVAHRIAHFLEDIKENVYVHNF
jgi:1-deoxy-D-xylulose-5-phosphate synthase